MNSRLTRLTVALVLVMGLLAACGPTPAQQAAQQQPAAKEASKAAEKPAAAATYKMRIGHPMAPSHQVSKGYDKFKELVEQKTAGKVSIEIFPNSVIGSDRETHEAMQKGTLEMSSSSTPNMASFTNKFLATDLPYIIETKEEAKKVADGAPGDVLRAEVEKVGMKILMFTDYGFRQVGTVKNAVKLPADIKGLKWRTTNSPVEIAVFKALGSNPTPIAWGEVFTALQQGTIDGEGNSYSLLYHSKHHEVLKFMAETNYNYSYHVLCINKKYFEGLPKDIQDALTTSSKEALDWERQMSDQTEKDAEKAMVDSGVKIYKPTAQELAQWKEPMTKVWDEFVAAGKADPEFVDLILKTLGKTKESLFKK